MRSILVHADSAPAFETRLQAALDIARAVDGHIHLHINTPFQRFVAMDPFGGAYLAAQAIEQAAARETALAERLVTRMDREDVPWNIESSSSEPVDALVSAARLADLVVVTLTTREDDGPLVSAMPVGALAVGARAPVLAIPSDRKSFMVSGKAMVAWDGSHESANALRAAVPMLMLADEVRLVTVADKTDGFPATDALRYLAHYGIRPELHESKRTHPTIEETLDAIAADLAVDWVAMGAYGHSRLRETVFGGVTRYFLDFARYPLLLVH
jgi:nucleotide-binding universal stress UspA family protein